MFETLSGENYDIGSLNESQQNCIKGYDFAIEDASNKEFIIDDLIGVDDSIIGRMKAEIASETLDRVVEYMEMQREDLLISFIDSQEDGDDF